MSAAENSRKNVLFVDDDAEFLGLLQPCLERLSRGEWNVLVALDSRSALDALASRPIDLVVLDVRMPVVDGVQLLQLVHRKHPQLRKAVLSGFVDETTRATALGHGAELVLEKPRDGAGYEALFTTLNELAFPQTEPGFRGVLRRVGLEDVIQMECLSRHSLVLEVSASGTRGWLYIREGALIHAQFGETVGEVALQELLTLPGGEFHHRPFTNPPRQTLEGSWEFLLMEAVRKRDEAAGTGSPEGAGNSATADSASARAAIRPPAVNEVVVCSGEGELLYSAQSANANQRCSMCRDLVEAATRLQSLLPLGAFERVEFVSTSGRMMMRVQEGHAIFLRASDV